MRNLNTIILSAVDTSSQNGSQIDTNQLVSASFQATFGDSSANGTVKIQASNDVSSIGLPFTVTNWVDIPNASASIASGASAIISIPQMAYRWIRAVYTRSSGGSSTITITMDALGL